MGGFEVFFCTKSIFLAKRSIVAYSIQYIFWKLLSWRLIWYIWGPSTCIQWPVRFFVTFWEWTGSISWNHRHSLSGEGGGKVFPNGLGHFFTMSQRAISYFRVVRALARMVFALSNSFWQCRKNRWKDEKIGSKKVCHGGRLTDGVGLKQFGRCPYGNITF